MRYMRLKKGRQKMAEKMKSHEAKVWVKGWKYIDVEAEDEDEAWEHVTLEDMSEIDEVEYWRIEGIECTSPEDDEETDEEEHGDGEEVEPGEGYLNHE